MKLYLFDTINRFKRYSEMLDVKTKICNRPWIVFNDGGEKEVYKFKEDGTINIVLSGRVTRGTWEYDPTDKTIIISASDQSYMVHPGMYDDMLLAFQVDGTNECSFLIEENNSKDFAPKTYSDLMLYFEEKERKVLEEEKRILLLKEEEERAKIKAEEEAKKKKQEEEAKKKKQEEETKRKRQEEERLRMEFDKFLSEKKFRRPIFVFDYILDTALPALYNFKIWLIIGLVYFLFDFIILFDKSLASSIPLWINIGVLGELYENHIFGYALVNILQISMYVTVGGYLILFVLFYLTLLVKFLFYPFWYICKKIYNKKLEKLLYEFENLPKNKNKIDFEKWYMLKKWYMLDEFWSL